jgi:L-alanine-DL-glutamate epimerase-like enolase superfamily enzyme
MSQIVAESEVHDIRFPTSEHLDGSDAMNLDPDHSAYVVIRTTDGSEGQGFCFTIGRGNDVIAAIEALRPYVIGRPAPRTAADLAALHIDLTHDSQLRWLGPEKGVMHMAAGAVVNAAWDLAAAHAWQPIWEFLASMTPEELVSLVDFRYLTDVLTREEALAILRSAEPGRAERAANLREKGYPAYTTSPGWLGYSDEKLVRLAKEAIAVDFVQIDAARVADVNENIAILLLAAKYGVPVCPHVGGVGLCELVQHLAMFDYVAVSGSWEDRIIEYVNHLHEHFSDPSVIDSGRYVAPHAPGFSARMVPESIASYCYPQGPVWQARCTTEEVDA